VEAGDASEFSRLMSECRDYLDGPSGGGGAS
jgi:hypothetical protein